MAENRNLHVNLSVKADTSQAKKQIDDLNSSLNKLSNVSSTSLGKTLSKDILQASDAALTLKQNLQAATNVNTGKLDLSVFQKKMQQSGQSLESYRQQLSKLGPEGEQAFLKLAQSVANAEIPLRKTNTLLTEFAGTLKNTARWQISSSILHGFMGAIQSAYGYAQDLNRSLNDIQIVTQHNSDYMAKFAEEANKAAKELSTTTTQYTNASLIFYQQGLSDAEVKKRTDVVIKMANASRQSAEEVSSQMTAVWNNFADGSKTLEYYADVMTALGAATASSSSEIAQGLQKFASIGETVGLSYEYAASALATITATTRESADTVGNALKTLFARIQGLKLGETLEDGVDLNKYSTALAKVGVNVLDANGQLRDMDNILEDLGAKWQEISREQQTALAQTVAGVRQYAQFMTLMNNWDFMKENLNTSYNAEGTLQKQADTYAQSWEAAQKRVKVAMQTIYQDLLDDKFFIGLNNSLAKVLEGIDGFIKSIGGLKGVLTTTGTLFLSIFEKQIISGIENATYSLQMFSSSGKQAFEELKNQAAAQIEQIAAGYDSNGLTNMAEGFKRISELQKIYVNEYPKMNSAEEEHAQRLLERQHRLEEIVQKSGQQVDLIQKEGMELAALAQLESKQSGLFDRADYNDSWNRLEDDVKSYHAALEQLTQAHSNVRNDIKLTDDEISNLSNALSNLGVNMTQEQFDGLKNGGIEARQVLEELRQSLAGNFADAQRVFQVNTGVSSERIQQLIDNLLREIEATKQEENAIDSAKNAHEEAAESLKKHAQEVDKNIQGFVKFSSGITSIISGINSLGRAIDTITDKEKPISEKILPTISSLAMGLPMLARGISSVITNFGPMTQFISGLPELFGGALVKIGSLIAGAFGPAGWVAIVIGAAIAGIIALTEHFSEKTESDLEKVQKSYEKMANASKQAMEDADKLAQKYDSVNEALSKYEDAVAALDACTTGTEEWYKALDDVNTALNNILQQSPELAQFIDTSGNIDLEAAHKYLETLQNNQMMTMFAGNIGTAVTNKEDASVNREELKNDIIGALDQGFQVVAEKEGIEGQRVYANGYNYGYASDEVLNSGTFAGGVIENIHLDDSTIDELSSKINENPNLTVDEVRDLLFDVIDSNYFGEEKEFTVQNVSKDAEGNLQWGEDEIIAREDFINNIIDQNFTEILNKFAPKVEAVEKEMDIAADAVKGMATGAINYKLSQEKNLMTFDELGDASKDVLAAYMGSKLPDQIQKLADSYEKESEMSHEELWAKYNNVMGTNYKMTSDEDGKFTYQDEKGSEQKIDISAVAYEIATITTLTDNWDESLKTAEDELTNLLSKTSGPFVQYLSDMSHHFENMSKTDINNFLKMVDGFNGEANNATSAKEILKWLTDVDKGLGMTEEMAKAYGFDSLQEMAERIKQDYDDYQTGIDNLISSVPANIKESFENLANNSDLTSSELTVIKDSLVHAVAVGGKEAGETLMSIFENAEDAGALADEINKIDWNETSVDGFVDQMVELGLIAPGSEEALKGVLEQLQEISLIDIGQAIAYYNADQKAINAAKSGSNISQEDYDNTSDDIKEFFTLMADGTYKMTGDAEEFYKVANESSIQGFKDNIVKLKEQEESYNRISERGVDYFSNGSFYNSEQNSYDKQGFLDTIEVLKSAGVDMETIDKWMADLNDDGLITQDTIKEIQKSLVDCAENGFNTLTENAEANSKAQEQNRIALLSAAKTYEDFQALVNEGYANKEDQDLWEQIGFDPSTVKNAEDLIDQIKNKQLTTQEAIKAGWDAVKGSTDELSISGFKTLLDSFEETDDKAAFAEEAIKKVSLSATDLLALDKTGIKGLLSEETWESICKEIDATGLTLSEIDSKYKNILPTSIYEKWAAAAEKATLETITNVKDLETEFENSNIKADSFSLKLQELFKNGDVTLEEALQSVYDELKNGEIEASDARDIINALLNNSSVTSEQKIKALNDEISKGLGNAQTYHDLITEIMGSKDMTSQQKLAELGKTTFDRSDKTYHNNYSAEDRYAGYSQLVQDESLSSDDRQKALEGMKRAMDELGESAVRTREYADAVMKVSQDAGDTAEETATKLFEAFGGANMDPDNWVTFGTMIKTVLSDMEGDAEAKMKFIQELLEGTGISIEQLQISLDNLGGLDLSGKSLAELRSKDEYKNDPGYDKAVEDALATETNLAAVRESLQAGQIDAEHYSQKVAELFNNDDITLEQALTSIDIAEKNNALDAEQAAKVIDELLNQSSMTTEERLKAINEKIEEGKASAEDYSEKLKLILEDDTKTDQTKLNELTSKDENGEYIYSAEDREAGLSSLLDSEALSYEQLAQVMEEVNIARQELNYSGDEAIIKTAQHAEEVQELSQKMGDSAEETAAKVAEAYGKENINSENLQLFGAQLKEIMSDSELTVEEKINYVKELLTSMGLTLDDVGLKVKDFGSFQLDTENFTIAENLERMNEALDNGLISNIDEYGQHLETLLKGELDWSMTTEQATAKLINFEVALAKSKDALNDQAGSIARLCESTEDYEILMSALARNGASEEETNRIKQISLSEIAKKYDSCTQALSKYEAALRSGDKQQIDSAESALTLSAKCAENAKQFSINATEVEALAKSYMNLNGTLDENGDKIEMSAEMASDLAARDINLNKGIADLQKNWESYGGALEQLQAYYDPLTGSFTDAYSAIEGQGEALEGVRDAVANVLNVTDSASISNEFLAENADLVAAAMNGEQWAVEALQVKLAEGLQAEIGLDDSEFQAIAAEVGLECENLADWLQNLPEGQITANNLDFVQKLVDSMVQAGMAQEEIEDKLSGLGIDVDLEPFAEEMQEAVNIAEQGAQGIADVTEQGAQAVTDASQQGAQNMADNYAEGADNAAESAGLDAETESSKTVDEDVEEAVSFYGEASPVRSMGLIPKFTAMPIGNAGFTFPVFAGFDNISATYPGVTMSPDVVPETATKESTATALRVKSANKSSGGNISHKNISGGNKPTSSGGSRGGGGGSRTPRSSRSSSPRASAPRVTKVDAPNITPTTRNTFTPERHDQMSHTDNQYEEKYHERIDPRTLYESVDNYIKQDPKRTLAKIIEDKDEVYTNRKVFRHERYEKDKQVDEKEYETKDASMYKRMSEEIDQYHDINKVLENIGNKLDEIDQRKSRAFGKAHIDAINEERAALEEQLAAQNQYITQMANDRKKLQDEMKATGWEFADNGDVSNYVQKKTKDVLDFNSAMEKWVDDTNKSREDWNDQAQEIADSYNKTNRDITDEYNLNMDKATVKYNTGVEQLDKITNAANKQITADLNAANERLAREKDQALQKAIDQYNDTAIGAVLERNQEIVTNINNRENSLTNAENQHRSSWMGTEYQRRAELTSNEQQNDITLSSLEQNLYSGQMATEAQRVAENEAAISSFNSSISGYTGSYQDSDAASAAKDHVSQAKSDLDNARKIIDNNAQNTQKLLENDYKNAEAAEQNRAKERQKQIENNAKNALDQINNTYKIAEQQAEGQYKTDETISKNKLKAAITAADNVLAAQTQSAEEIFEEGSQLVQHNANVAFKRVSNTYDRGIEELQRVYDDEAWLADQLKQDRKEQLESWFDARNEQNDKDLEAAQKLTDLAKEQGEFAYEESSKMLDEYESLSSTMTEAMMEAQEIRNKLYDNAIEVIDYTLNLKVEISNQVMVALQALLDALGTSADLAADRIANLAQQMNQFEYQTKETRKGILELINSTGDVSSDVLNRFMQGTFSMDDLNKIFNVDEFTADKIESLKTYRDNLVELINEQRALKQQMFDNVNNAFSEYQEKLGLQIEKITNLTKVTETYKAIVGIVGKEVLDASGKLSETLAKSAFETQRDQTHTYKSILDEIDSNIADMKQKQSQFDTGSEMYKDFQTQIEQMEATRKSAQDNWLSSWQAEMQAATDYYSEAIDTITMHLEKSMAGLIGSLDLLSNEYDRQKQISEVYVEDYEKIYQLNKLNRDVQNALDDSDHIKNKQQLKKLQQEINAANEDGVKMSQYDLDVLRKKFELELAREELEESRNAKSQVRMMRDAEGNYGYVYTADANAVADAEQNYEDKLHELQVLNTDYIKQLEDNYLSLQQNVRDEIASLDISQFSSEAEYLAEVDRIQQAALELQERYGQQMDNATNNNRSLYENEWRAYSEMTGYKISADEEYLDKFEETTYSVLTGFQSMQEAKDQFTSSLAQAVTDAILAFQETRDMQEIAMHDGNLSLEDGEDGLSKFADRAIEETDKITSQTEEIADQAELMSENFQNAFEQIADSASVFAENYVSAIQPVIDSNLQLLDSIAKLIEHQANLADQSGDGSGSGGITSGTRSAGTTWDAFATAGGGTEVKSRIGEYLPFIGALLQYGSYESDYEGWGTGETRRENLKKVFGDGADQDINNWLSEHAAGDSGSYWLTIANNPAAYSLNAMKKLMGVSFDTGGYTGNWNSLEGKLALLHEKELVLNKEDTNNILEAVDMVRKITQMIDLNALSAGTFMSDILSAATINSSNSEVLQQEVHITAEFPNATDRAEIIAAFDNLTNLAVQYAGKQNY